MDVHTKKQRSYNMSRIKARDTKPELIIKKGLRGHGFTYHPDILGNPDFANKKEKIAVFVDGCFWHKCPKCYKESAIRKEFWNSKINNNIRRDRKVNKELSKRGWSVIRIWEHDIKTSTKNCIRRVMDT